MKTAYYTHALCHEHDPGRHHPENPARLTAVESALAAPAFSTLQHAEMPEGTLDQIALVHDWRYAAALFNTVPEAGHIEIDGDTVLSPGSGRAALRAIGALCAAVDDVATGRAANAFCAVRPPGHHATASRAMGFCVFNQVAIAALYAQETYGVERVAIIDFDVHHGNGTQDILQGRAGMLYVSTHQSPLVSRHRHA